jgi:DNA-binding transcriptional regulator PaaX
VGTSRTFSRLSSRAAAILDDGARRIFSFGAANQSWDGMWSLIAFSIPEDNRAARDALRKQLRWLGFAPLHDGLWLSPRDHAAEELLPSAWPRARARELFIGCYDLLGPLAARRVRQIITRYSPELAGRAAYHSSELKLSAAPTSDGGVRASRGLGFRGVRARSLWRSRRGRPRCGRGTAPGRSSCP